MGEEILPKHVEDLIISRAMELSDVKHIYDEEKLRGMLFPKEKTLSDVACTIDMEGSYIGWVRNSDNVVINSRQIGGVWMKKDVKKYIELFIVALIRNDIINTQGDCANEIQKLAEEYIGRLLMPKDGRD